METDQIESNRSNDPEQQLRMIQQRKFKKESIIYGIPVKMSKNRMNNSMMMKTEVAGSMSAHFAKNRPFMDYFVIGPDNKINGAFSFILIFLALFSTLLSAYYACFGAPTERGAQIFDYVMEGFFLIDVLRSFLREYQDEETHKSVRDLKRIAKRYLASSFIFDVISLSTLPIYEMTQGHWDDQQRSLLYILRLLRVEKIFVILNIQVFQRIIKAAFRSSLNASIARNSTRQEDNKEDNNKIMHQIIFMYVFRVVRLIIFILILSYFLGTIWYIVSKQTSQSDSSAYTFYNSYELADKDETQRLIIVVYFIFTTLSTVGFGDYTPKSEVERVFTTIILLVGVAVFSYIMGQFIEILMNLQTVTADNEDSENLSKWLGLLAHFNKNKPLPKTMTKQFEVYFEYYWQNDKNYAIQTEEDNRFMEELPNNIRTDIYKEFLFADFLYMFNIHFKMQREDSLTGGNNESNFYDWPDTQYSQFMIELLQSLEPRFYVFGEIIFEENDEVNEQIYVISKSPNMTKDQNNMYQIGFTDQKQMYFHVRLGYKTIIGGYENLFGRRAEFCYRALHHIDAYGLRKEKLKPIIDKYEEFKKQISSYMVNFYYKIIRKPMLEYKRNVLSAVRKRQEMDAVIKEVDKQIQEAQERFTKEFSESYGSETNKSDQMHKNVQKLERKVNHLARSIHDLFLQIDQKNLSQGRAADDNSGAKLQ